MMGTLHPKNQLDSVICQIRFPALLSIVRDLASFQEKISAEYPVYELAAEAPLGVANIPTTNNHIFKTVNGDWSISVSVSTLSLTTSAYTNWKEFQSRFATILDAFRFCFPVETIHRVGLRYINAIRPSSLDLESDNLELIFKKNYLNHLGINNWHTFGFNSTSEYRIDERCACRIGYGSIQFADSTHEFGALIDTDVYSTSQQKITEIMGSLKEYHNHTEAVFRELTNKSIQDKVGL